MANFLISLDAYLSSTLHGWNIYTTLLLLLLATIFIYPAIFTPDPDIHPLLLARQSAPSRVRHPGFSATYRALDTPHSYPLRSGLNVKDPTSPKWARGRDGDLRDIWKKAARPNPRDDEGQFRADAVTGGAEAGVDSSTLTRAGSVKVLMGKEEVLEFGFEGLTREVNAIGGYLKKQGGKKVGVYLSNSVEFLVAVFACAFYDLTPVLIPTQDGVEDLAAILKKTEADTIIVGAGSVPLTELVKFYGGLKQVVWVVARSSRHMDWHEVAEGEGGKAGVAVWHEIVEEAKEGSELPSQEAGASTPNIVIAGKGRVGFEVTEYTQANLVAAISGQLSVLPRSYSATLQHHITPLDTVISLAPLTDIYPLTIMLGAMFANASLALTSVCGPQASYASAFKGVHPTIIIALPSTLGRLCADKEAHLSGTFHKYMHDRGLKRLNNGSMPKTTIGVRDVRLIYTYEQFLSPGRAPLIASQLNGLRLFTGARIVFAHTAAKVAGAVCQTNLLDYSNAGRGLDQLTHLGPPLGCLEVKLKSGDGDIDDSRPTGRPIVTGPAVVGGEVELDEVLAVTDSNTFAYPS